MNLALIKEKVRNNIDSYFNKENFRLHKFRYMRDASIVGGAITVGAVLFTVSAATYTFVQTSWAGGETVNNANHTTDRTGWTEYSAKDSTTALLNGGVDIEILSVTGSSTQTSNSDFALGTLSSTAVGGSGISGMVSLAGTSPQPPWSQIANTPGSINGGAGLAYPGSGDFLYGFRGNSTTDFYRYSISGNSWTSMGSAPDTISWGSSLVSDGADYIYGFRGSGTGTLYRYSISSNTWTTLNSAPITFGYGGGALVYTGGDYLYSIKGTQSKDFYRYSISGNSWTAMASTSANMYTGSKSLIFPGSGDFIYAQRGDITTDFYRYSISGNSWAPLASSSVSSVTSQGILVYPGSGDYIFQIPGGETSGQMIRYSISSNSWVEVTSASVPFANGYTFTNAGNYMYGVKGGNTTSAYKFDFAGGVTSGWTALASSTSNVDQGAGLVYSGSGDYLHGTFGGQTFLRYSLSGNNWTSRTNIPTSIYQGGALVSTGNDYLYATQGNTTNQFSRYSISGNSWTAMATTPRINNYGTALLYTGEGDYIYELLGSGTKDFYRYSISGNSWTALASSSMNGSFGTKMVNPGGGDYIYATLLDSISSFGRYSISANSWSTMASPHPSIGEGSSLVYPGSGDYIYLTKGGSYSFYRYSISQNVWEGMPILPAIPGNGATLMYPGSGSLLYWLRGGGKDFYKFSIYTYPSSGTFTSSSIDTGSPSSFTSLQYTASTPASTSLSVDVRAGNTASPDGTWTAWQTGISNGGSISALNDKRYVQYRANLASSDSSVTPSLSDITFNYSNYASSTTFTSSAFDSSSGGNIMGSIEWSESAPAGTAIKFQMRSAADATGAPGAWSGWMGPDGTSATYFTSNDGSDSMPAVLKDATNDQWFQYKAFLTTTVASTPTLSEVTVTYVVNAPPTFDATFGNNGVTVEQVATTTDPEYGKVHITYRVKDTDTTTGSITPGFITPSFEYNIGGGWVAIPQGNLSAGSTDNKVVSEVTFNTYEAYFDAKTLISDTYAPSAQIRVRINDNEGANNLAYASSSNFLLDTRNPAVASFHLDGTSGTSTITFSATDATSIRNYTLSNNSNFTTDGLNGTSGVTQAVGTTSLIVSSSWSLAGTSTKVVHLRLEDMLGNVTTSQVIVPGTPSNVEYRDLSNLDTEVLRIFVAWNLYPDPVPNGAPYASYELYRSTDEINYSLVYTSTNPSINYYLDTNVESGTTYSYKVAFVTSNGDKSLFSPVVSDAPDGKGGTNNGAIPIISNVQVTDIKNTSAKVTWTTDDLALSEVDYGGSLSYGSVASNRSYVTEHAVYLTSLQPNTTYYVRTRSIDVYSGTATNDNSGAGYSFTTGGGPVISNVTTSSVSDVSAEIVWNTSIAADSHVFYSTSPTLVTYTEAGNDDLVSSPFQHKVTITGLTTDTTYYFKVSSKDASDNTTTDTNNDSYYTFKTSYDTKAPVISQVVVPVRASDGAVVTWTTDELSTSKVEYGTASGAPYANATAEIMTNSIFHSVTLSSETIKEGGGTNVLTKLTKYYYRVKSRDPAGNTTYSEEQDFTTTEDGAVTQAAAAGGGGGYSSQNIVADTKAPIISDVDITNVTPFGATLTFTTNEDARAIVEYGNSTVYSGSAGNPTLSKKHSVPIKGLRMGTTYHTKISVVDGAGNVASSPDETFKTTNIAENLGNLLSVDDGMADIQQRIEDIIESALPSINPPFIENPVVESLGEDFATITWRTNVKAFGTVLFAEDREFKKTGEYTSEVTRTDEKRTQHMFDLSGLKPNTKYHYKLRSYVFLGAPGESKDYIFTTKASGVQVQIADRKKDSMRVLWTTVEPTTSVVTYKKKGFASQTKKIDDSLTTNHDIKLENLAPATTYELRVFGLTEDGNTIESKNATIVSTNQDTRAPVITNFKVDSALVAGRTDRTQTIVSWKTDEPSNSAVYYDEGSGISGKVLSNKKEDLSSYTDNHVIILTSLKPGTIYRFQIVSSDDANNTTKLPVRTIVTPSQSESVVDVIFKNFDDTFKFMKAMN